ncbi:MAG: hypothetical protein QM597_03555 [Aeromicrobium sp.]|uniref:hypothetical protein n=1 Tax=Aeromicrobium sp. TaxID=1871063 RepID=UPI0039E405EC
MGRIRSTALISLGLACVTALGFIIAGRLVLPPIAAPDTASILRSESVLPASPPDTVLDDVVVTPLTGPDDGTTPADEPIRSDDNDSDPTDPISTDPAVQTTGDTSAPSTVQVSGEPDQVAENAARDDPTGIGPSTRQSDHRQHRR